MTAYLLMGTSEEEASGVTLSVSQGDASYGTSVLCRMGETDLQELTVNRDT